MKQTTTTCQTLTDVQVAAINLQIDQALAAEQARKEMVASLATALVTTGGGIVDDLRMAAAETVAGWGLNADTVAEATEDHTFYLVRAMLDGALPA